MAILALTNAKVLINAVDLSDHVREVRINYKGDPLDSTAMGNTTHQRIGGLFDWDLQVIFEHDEAAGKVEATMFPLIGTVVTIDVQAVNAARSTTNPSYTGQAFIESMEPIVGAVGQLALDTVHALSAGALTRAVV